MRNLVISLLGLIRSLINALVSTFIRIWNRMTKRKCNVDSLLGRSISDIITKAPPGYSRLCAIELSLPNLPIKALQDYFETLTNQSDNRRFSYSGARSVIDNAAKELAEEDDGESESLIKSENFLLSEISNSLEVILMYAEMIKLITSLSGQECTWENELHKKKLHQIWKNLIEGEELEADVSSQWSQLGFQGKNPCTDFRGCGVLALNFLLYLSTKHQISSKEMLRNLQNKDPAHELPFALIVIHSTDISLKLCQSGKAKTHFFNVMKPILPDESPINESQFEVVFWEADLLVEFYKFTTAILFQVVDVWLSSGVGIMDFVPLKAKFVKSLENSLLNSNSIISMENSRV